MHQLVSRRDTRQFCSAGSLPLAVLFLVGAAVLATSAENVHYLRDEARKHRLLRPRETASVALLGRSACTVRE